MVKAGFDAKSTGDPASRRACRTESCPHRAATCSAVNPCPKMGREDVEGIHISFGPHVAMLGVSVMGTVLEEEYRAQPPQLLRDCVLLCRTLDTNETTRQASSIRSILDLLNMRCTGCTDTPTIVAIHLYFMQHM